MIERTLIGSDDGRPVEALTLRDGKGRALGLLSHGARITRLATPDRDGVPGDIVLGFDDLEPYRGAGASFGATCGPVGNRIRNAAFAIDGVTHRLEANDGPNTRHGGARGYSRRNWTVESVAPDETAVTFLHRAEDGDGGFPGPVAARVRYRLTDDGVLIEMSATAAKPTIVNLIQHAYFNLDGHGAGSILDHQLQVSASRYTPLDAAKLPTGAICDVDGTPFDFRVAKPIGRDLAALAQATGQSDGYDHNWALDGAGPRGGEGSGEGDGALFPAAALIGPRSGRRLRIETNQPGLQVYAGGGLKPGTSGKDGAVYGPFSGVALETQRFPDSANTPGFPSPALRPGDSYRHLMRLRLDVV